MSTLTSQYGDAVNGGTETAPQSFLYKTDLPRSEYEKIRATDSGNPNTSATAGSAAAREADGLNMVELRGVPLDDARWDELVDQMTTANLKDLIGASGYGSTRIGVIGKPSVTYADGPNGLSKGYIFPCGVMIAQTWDEDLAAQMGDLVGEDSLACQVSGWYGPGLNLHRTPFSGRNFEYFSEDPVLSGIMGAAEVKAAAKKGVLAYGQASDGCDRHEHCAAQVR